MPPNDSVSSVVLDQTETKTRSRVVIDTSVFIADPYCIYGIDSAEIVIPLVVIEELDSLKSRNDDTGRSARSALRLIEDIRTAAGGSLSRSTAISDVQNSSVLRIEVSKIDNSILIDHGLDQYTADNKIIATAINQSKYGYTSIISNDAALRIKASHLGIPAREHLPARVDRDRKNPGWTTIELDSLSIDRLHSDGILNDSEFLDDLQLINNEFVVAKSGNKSALARYQSNNLMRLSHVAPDAWGLRPRSKEQRFALDLLLDQSVQVIALDGRAGTGKTIVAVAAGLEQVVEKKLYERLSIYRPLVPISNSDVGFLPGDLSEKLDPWMSAIYDAIVALTDGQSKVGAQSMIDELLTREKLTLESVTFLRGRSLHRQFIIVDEAQNLEPTTLKTILTRVGEGSKIVFTGDTTQIDAPYLGESNNALAVLINAFADQECFGHVMLSTCERSEVAKLAAELL